MASNRNVEFIRLKSIFVLNHVGHSLLAWNMLEDWKKYFHLHHSSGNALIFESQQTSYDKIINGFNIYEMGT